jgi:hypothetical protein
MTPARGKAVPTKTRRPSKKPGAETPAGTRTPRPETPLPPRLVCFLYLLMRDTVAVGEVARLAHESMSDVDSTKAADALKRTYSNKHLEEYAREVAADLVLDDEPL